MHKVRSLCSDGQKQETYWSKTEHKIWQNRENRLERTLGMNILFVFFWYLLNQEQVNISECKKFHIFYLVQAPLISLYDTSGCHLRGASESHPVIGNYANFMLCNLFPSWSHLPSPFLGCLLLQLHRWVRWQLKNKQYMNMLPNTIFKGNCNIWSKKTHTKKLSSWV